MNNEETMIMQPQKSEANNQKNATNAEDVKNQKNGSTAARIAATTAAGVFGGAMGGAGSVAATQMMNTEEPEVLVEEETQATEAKQEPVAQSTSVAEDVKEEELVVTEDAREEEDVVANDETEEPDYTNHDGADPVVNSSQQEVDGNDSGLEVQVLGVYENEIGQEMAVLTDGELVAAVLDATGDGESNLIGIDEDRNGTFEEGEIHDISDQHISMSQYEEAYIAQHQMEVEQHDTFAYNADEQSDYNNDADMYYDA